MLRATSIALLAIPLIASPLVSVKSEPRRGLAPGSSPVPLAAPAASPHLRIGQLAPQPLQEGYRHRPSLYGAARAGFATDQIWGRSGPNVVIIREPRIRREIRPLSASVIDPYAVVTRTASGRVAISSGIVGLDQTTRPYAPPTFQMLGAPAGPQARFPVKLTHGVAAPASLPLGPKVVWLNERGEGDPSPHVKMMR